MSSKKENRIAEDDPQPHGKTLHGSWQLQDTAFHQGGSGGHYCEGPCGKWVTEVDITITRNTFSGDHYYCVECAEKLGIIDLDGVYNPSRERLRTKKRERRKELIATQRELIAIRIEIIVAERKLEYAKHTTVMLEHDRLRRWLMQDGIGL